jgi:hypothetical protein
MYDAFHGNMEKDTASQAKLLINGAGHEAYAGLYEPLVTVTNASTATDLSLQAFMIKKLIMNDSKSLHTVRTTEGKDITLNLLHSLDSKKICYMQKMTIMLLNFMMESCCHHCSTCVPRTPSKPSFLFPYKTNSKSHLAFLMTSTVASATSLVQY